MRNCLTLLLLLLGFTASAVNTTDLVRVWNGDGRRMNDLILYASPHTPADGNALHLGNVEPFTWFYYTATNGYPRTYYSLSFTYTGSSVQVSNSVAPAGTNYGNTVVSFKFGRRPSEDQKWLPVWGWVKQPDGTKIHKIVLMKRMR